MLHKYYCCGSSNNYNLKFSSDTCCDGIWTIPDIQISIRNLLQENKDKLEHCLDGYKQCLYLEKSENTNKYWKVVIGVWRNKMQCEEGYDPNKIIRITTKDFRELVIDKYTGQYYEDLPISCINDERIRMFY